MKKNLLFLLLFISTLSFAQPPQIDIKVSDSKEVKDTIVEMMSRMGYSIFDSNEYKIDFRKDIEKGSNFFGDAFSYAMDSTRASSEGFEFTIIPMGDTTTVKNLPYLISTYQNGSNPVKRENTGDSNKYAVADNLLRSLRNMVFFKEYNKTAKVKINSITNGAPCNDNGGVWINSIENGIECKK